MTTSAASASVRMALTSSYRAPRRSRRSRTLSTSSTSTTTTSSTTTTTSSISPWLRSRQHDKRPLVEPSILRNRSSSSSPPSITHQRRHLSSSSSNSPSACALAVSTSTHYNNTSSLSSSSSSAKEIGTTVTTLSSTAALMTTFMFGFVAAATYNTTQSSSSSSSIKTECSADLNGGGGSGGLGSGPGNNVDSSSSSSPILLATTIAATAAYEGTRKAAEEDVQTLEEEAIKNPYLVSIGFEQGARWTMEDRYSIKTGGRFVGVFDGHGGDDVSTRLEDTLHTYYQKVLSSKHWEESDYEAAEDPPGRVESKPKSNLKKRIPSIGSHVAALRGALEIVEADVIQEDHLVYQGSTAVVVVVHVAEDGRRTVLSANVGDSRAILSRKGRAIDLTRDHKPNDEREKARIRAHGEDIEWDPYGEVYRVRDLSLSRVIGDRFAKPVVSDEAEIKRFPVHDDEDEFILLGSDGLFDVMESQEVVDFVHECLNEIKASSPDVPISYARQRMAKNVANEALERGTADNVCVIMVWLNNNDEKEDS